MARWYYKSIFQWKVRRSPTSFSTGQGLSEGGQLVDVQEDPGEVANEEGQDDRQEDGGQAVLLSPHQPQVGRVHVVRALQARAAFRARAS